MSAFAAIDGAYAVFIAAFRQLMPPYFAYSRHYVFAFGFAIIHLPWLAAMIFSFASRRLLLSPVSTA